MSRSRDRRKSDGDRVGRAEQKQNTRRALLDAALRLLAHQSFDSLSLREVTREVGIVPTAFYRHFSNMEELGLVLVDESFRTMRRLVRAAREEPLPQDQLIRRSVEAFTAYVRAHRTYFQFIARERFGGVDAIRAAIRNEIRLFVSELATDLARSPLLETWSTQDLQMLASLIVGAMTSVVEQLVDVPSRSAEMEADIIRVAKNQLRLITLGIPLWRVSRGESEPPPPASGDGLDPQP
jgi:AcrR family transcriptional regulator